MYREPFSGTNQTFALGNESGAVCSSYAYFFNSTFENFSEYENSCASGPQDPSAVNFGGNSIGVAYSSITNNTLTDLCPGATNLVHSGVYFQTSNDSGANWTGLVNIGNATCSYLQSFDPSVALANGTVYAAFVESNESNATTPIVPVMDNLSSDAIGFTTSTNNGSTFAPVVSLTAPGVGQPHRSSSGGVRRQCLRRVREYGQLDEHDPSALYLQHHPLLPDLRRHPLLPRRWNDLVRVRSTFRERTPRPATRPIPPPIAINSLGELAVSYATDRSCILVNGYCYDYGDAIVVSTSTTNGTNWSAPVALTPVAGEYGCQYEDPLIYNCLPGPEQGPHSSIAFDPSNPSQVYVVFTESYYTWNTTQTGEGGGSGVTNIGYGQALISATSSNTGLNWTLSIIELPITAYGYSYDAITNPAVTVSVSGEVYVSFTWLNDTSCAGCNPAFDEYTSYWMGHSTDQGAKWTVYPALLTNVYEFEVSEDWYGLTSAVTVTAAGPVGVFGEGLGQVFTEYFNANYSGSVPAYTYIFNYTYQTNLISIFPSQATPFAVNFTEVGLPTNTTWGFTLSGNMFASNDTTIQVTNVPYDASLTYESNDIPVAYWTEYFGTSNIADEVTFFGPT